MTALAREEIFNSTHAQGVVQVGTAAHKNMRTLSIQEIVRRSGITPKHEAEVPLALALGRWYTLRNWPEIQAFLENHPALVPVILHAPSQIESCFSRVPLALEVVSDPESPQYKQLVIFISTDLEPHEAQESRGRLAERWWLDMWQHTEQKLGISLEYR